MRRNTLYLVGDSLPHHAHYSGGSCHSNDFDRLVTTYTRQRDLTGYEII